MDDPPVVVTRAAGGIGSALVREFADAGATVAAAARTRSDDIPMPRNSTVPDST